MVDPACIGVLFNQKHKPFANEVFRKAAISALDRTKIREVANYYAKETDFAGVGMSLNQVHQNIAPEVLSKFTRIRMMYRKRRNC